MPFANQIVRQSRSNYNINTNTDTILHWLHGGEFDPYNVKTLREREAEFYAHVFMDVEICECWWHVGNVQMESQIQPPQHGRSWTSRVIRLERFVGNHIDRFWDLWQWSADRPDVVDSENREWAFVDTFGLLSFVRVHGEHTTCRDWCQRHVVYDHGTWMVKVTTCQYNAFLMMVSRSLCRTTRRPGTDHCSGRFISHDHW